MCALRVFLSGRNDSGEENVPLDLTRGKQRLFFKMDQGTSLRAPVRGNEALCADVFCFVVFILLLPLSVSCKYYKNINSRRAAS